MERNKAGLPEGGTRRVLLGLVVPMLLLVAFAAGVNSFVLSGAASQIDAIASSGETAIVRTLVDRARQTLELTAADYAAGSEIYENFAGPGENGWEDGNLGGYLPDTFGISEIYVVSADGAVRYAWAKGGRLAGDARESIRQVLARVLGRASAMPDVFEPAAISAFTVVDGIPHAIAASLIRPASPEELGNRELARNYLVLLSEFGSGRFAQIAGEHHIGGLRHAGAAPSGAPFVALRRVDGTPAGGLTWEPRTPGKDLLRAYWPTAILVLAATLLVFAALARSWMRLTRRVRQSETDALAAREANRAKSLFIANVSHELRTPLNAIIGFSEILGREILGPLGNARYRSYADDITNAGRHLLGLINDILLFARMEAGQQELDVSPGRVGDLVERAVRMFAVEASTAGITLAPRVACGPDAVVAHEKAAFQILINLVGNALKFTPAGGSVTITAACVHDADDIILRVSDTGIGIPARDLPKLGQPFVQVAGVFARNHGGTGLGLAISRSLAEKMGGTLVIASEEGRGTEVTVRLPRFPGAAGATGAEAA